MTDMTDTTDSYETTNSCTMNALEIRKNIETAINARICKTLTKEISDHVLKKGIKLSNIAVCIGGGGLLVGGLTILSVKTRRFATPIFLSSAGVSSCFTGGSMWYGNVYKNSQIANDMIYDGLGIKDYVLFDTAHGSKLIVPTFGYENRDLLRSSHEHLSKAIKGLTKHDRFIVRDKLYQKETNWYEILVTRFNNTYPNAKLPLDIIAYSACVYPGGLFTDKETSIICSEFNPVTHLPHDV